MVSQQTVSGDGVLVNTSGVSTGHNRFDSDMPDQKCGDCVHHPRCVMLFQCPATNEKCDWDPSRFRRKEVT